MDLTKLNVSADLKVGEITCDAEAVLAYAREIADYYRSIDYTEVSPTNAKHERAALNSAAKVVQQKRLEITKQYNEPLELFTSAMKAAENELKNAAQTIDVVVKEAEEREREMRLQRLHDLWLTMPASEHFGFTTVCEENWSNKTAKEKDVQEAMERISREVMANMRIIAEMPDVVGSIAAKEEYLRTYDFGHALRAAQAAAQAAAQQQSMHGPEKPVQSTPANAATTEPAPTKEDKTQYTIVLEIKGTRGQLEQLATECQCIGVEVKRLKLN